MRDRLKHLSIAARLALTVAVLAVSAGVVLGIRSTGLVRSQDRGEESAVDFTKITPLPFTPQTVVAPDYTQWTGGCQFPEDERPDPTLPPLSCRDRSSEPPPGVIPSVDPTAPRAAAPAPEGWRTIDNPLFRLTVQVPESWFSNMRPEGGGFAVYDEIATSRISNEEEPFGGEGPFGLVIFFAARKYVSAKAGLAESKLEHPNTTIAGLPAVTWDEGVGLGSQRIGFAFRNGDVLYEVGANVDAIGPSDKDISQAREIISTISLY